MKLTTKGDTFSVIAVTVAWLLTTALGWLVLRRIMKLPFDLTALLFVPVLLIWLPTSYRLAIAGNRRFRRNDSLSLSWNTLRRFGLLGVVTAAIIVMAIWIYGLYHAHAYLSMIIAGVVECAVVWWSYRILASIVVDLEAAESA
jgi:hypothetical protein